MRPSRALFSILCTGSLLCAGSPLAADDFFLRADANADGTADITDAVVTLSVLFLGDGELTCLDAADADDSGELDITDAIVTLGFLFLGDDPPPPPGPENCGRDPTADNLGCESFPPCPQSSGDPVKDSLTALNVETDRTPRVESVGGEEKELPEDYAPLGSRITVNRPEEVFVLGFTDQIAGGDSTRQTSIIDIGPAPDNEPALLLAPPSSVTPWAQDSISSRSVPQRSRDATSGDFDGDGLEEVVVAYLGDGELRFATFQDEDAGYSRADVSIVAAPEFTDVTAAAGDFDGDGDAEIAVALSRGDGVELLFVQWQEIAFVLVDESTRTIPSRGQGDEIFTSLDVGSVDRDRAQELVLVVNEQFGTFNGNRGLVHFHLYDDAAHGHEELKAGTLPYALGQQSRHAVVGDAALGDIDGDGVDELVLAGLANFSNNGSCSVYRHLFYAFDDARTEFVSLGTSEIEHFFRDCPAFSAWQLRYLHVNAGDIDGDRIDEVQVNQFIFEDWRNGGTWAELVDTKNDDNDDNDVVARIDEERFFAVNDFGWFDRSMSSMTLANVLSDGRDKIVFYTQNRRELFVWGLDSGPNGWSETRGDGSRGALIETSFHNAQRPINPVVVPVNATKDEGMVLEYSGAERKLIFTEPVIHAVLAAPPCYSEGGQVTDACRTSYGLSDSQTTSREERFTLSVSSHFGASVSFDVLGFELGSLDVKTTLSSSVSSSVFSAYTLEQTVEFTTGPLEDSVVFSTIPYDTYAYTVLSHPDPEMLGEQVVVSLPRTPITLMVERNFYNSSVAVGELQITDAILGHTIGEPASYPTRGDRNDLLGRWNGLSSDLQSVDQGGGERSVALSFREEFGTGYEFAIGSEFELSATTLGVVSGFSVGVEAASSLQYSKGQGTLYRGSVGALTDLFDRYSYGLFTYVYEDAASGQQFEVINYWVE